MTISIGHNVKETSTTTGTGTYSLAGAVSGFQSFVAGCGNGNETFYCAHDRESGGTNWEVGKGVVTDATPDTLTRASIIQSSNGGAAVNWAAGTRRIYAVAPFPGGTGGVTGSGAVVLSSGATINYAAIGFPTIDTPGIATFASANHSHQNGPGGGTLDAAAIAAGTIATARLGSGTANLLRALRGDQTWAKTPVLLDEETAANSATIDLTGATGYAAYEIRCNNVVPATDDVSMYLRISTDAGSSFKSGVADYGWTTKGVTPAGVDVFSDDQSDAKIILNYTGSTSGRLGNASGEHSSFVVILPGGALTGVKQQFFWIGTIACSASSGLTSTRGTGWYLTTGAINAVRFLMSSGNITSGTFQLWGIP